MTPRLGILALALCAWLTGAGCGSTDTGPTDTTAPPTSSRTPEAAPGQGMTGKKALYLALGDSLSEGVAASDPLRTAWVPLVATALGSGFELLNLGVAGHDSRELIEEGPLDAALAEIASRDGDAVVGNEVAAITLEIGGNDLLDLYFDLVLPGVCPTVEEGLKRALCTNELSGALGEFEANLSRALDELAKAAPGVPVFLMTLYNPFSGGSYNLEQIGILALEGVGGTEFEEGLNDRVRRQAEGRADVRVVEWYGPFLGKQGEYISPDFIHPNDVGYGVMAEEVLKAMEEAGLQ